MKHASPGNLNAIAASLDEIRATAALTETKRGIFYLGSKAFLHFHEDPAGIFADLKVGAAFRRFRVQTKAEQRMLLQALLREYKKRLVL